MKSETLIELPHHNHLSINRNISHSWSNLVALAREHGIEIKATSAYRSFQDQKRIWNLKASGQRTILDDHEKAIPFEKFNLNDPVSIQQLIFTILRWSALPGLSRHHWGTDLDIIDQQKLNQNPEYKVQLIPSEYAPGGIFEELGHFLDLHLESSDFFRPYRIDLGGVAPEPWHLSHKETAEAFIDQISIDKFQKFLNEFGEDLLLKDSIQENLEEIFTRFVYNYSS